MEEKTSLDSVIEPVKQPLSFPRVGSGRENSPSRKGGSKTLSVVSKNDDLEELDEDEEGDEMVQEVESPIDDSDMMNDPAAPISSQYHLWSMDWGDLDQDRRNLRKRPALEDLPDDVREELASMSGADTEIRPKQKPKLEPPDTLKESSRGRKSPAEEEGMPDISNILSKPARTPEERLAVLEARDKLIRIRSNQQICTQLKNVGRCPDMCPEKERYQRIARHQVDYYEYNRDNKEVNLASMVKIYARSSADQQMPLPHDLRPVNVLWMTMSYLVNQFMDLADSPGENLGEWYHFLWDRMRSIRKDITQLALCDTLSVQILEMCARFHIFCMERLREEKMAVFDEKINRENLTKCLQSLQYMYNDLFLKRISCPNEPEFQAYSILLHINSDLCTSTILGLRSEMRQHKKVQFAINVFLAVTMKNYVRFFKLVKSTSYLNACILHQYFAQVRAHAMHSIIRAYSRQKMRNTYPLSELQTQLLFDSNNDVLEFCRFSKVPVEESNIVLEKKTSHPIPMQEKMKRSFAGVECKRQSSIREIVAGGCNLADTATLHKVHDSFDEQGILKQEAWYAEDQEKSTQAVEKQDTRLLSKNTLESESSSSGHISAVERTSPGQGFVGSVPSTQFTAAQTGVLQTQNLGITGPQKSIFGISNPNSVSFNLPPATQSIVQANVESTKISGKVTMIPNSSGEFQEQQRPVSSFVFTQPENSKSPGAQQSTDVKSFVFRLPSAKSETKNRQGQKEGKGIIQSGFAVRTLQSIFGGSGSTPLNRSLQSSVLRTVLSGNDTKPSQKDTHLMTSEHWGSSREKSVHAVSTQQSDSEMETSTSNEPLISRDQSSESSFKHSPLISVTEADSTEKLPEFSVSKSGNFWSSSTTKPLFDPEQSFSNVTSTNSLTTLSPCPINQFPTSVYGLPSTFPSSSTGCDVKLKNVSVFPRVDTQPSSSHVSTDISPSLRYSQSVASGSHASPLLVSPRAVTVPTSIFGFHSRPLSTPQMFPTSSSSSTTISPQITSSTPTFSSVTTGQSNTSEVVSNNVSFAFSGGNSVPLTFSCAESFLSSPVVTAAVERTSQTLFPNRSSCSDKSKHLPESFNNDILVSSEMKIVSVECVENTEQLALKEAPFKSIAPIGAVVSTSETSPDKQKESSLPTCKLSARKVDKNEIQTMNEVFRKWRLFTYRSKLKRRIESQEKCAPVGTNLSLEEQANKFPIPQGCTVVDYQTRLEYLIDLREIKVSQSIFPDVGKIKLENILRSTLPTALLKNGRLEEIMFWKLCISLPGESEGKKFSLQICEWVNATFADDNESENDMLRTARTLIGEEYNLFTAVQRTIGITKQKIKGVNALLFFTPRNLSSYESTFERYEKLIQLSFSHFPVPLVAVVSNNQWIEVCRKCFTNDVERKRIADFKIIGPFSEGKESILKELTDSISWLSQQVIPAPPFEKWPLREVLLTIMSDLWARVRFTLSCRCSSGFQQHPDDLLGLYHDALKQLQGMIINDQLDKYTVIAPELENLAKHSVGDKFDEILQRDPKYNENIRKGFSQLQLNICMPPIELLSVESFCKAVCMYNPRLHSPVSHFLCSWENGGDIDWTYIVEKLSDMHIRDTIGNLKLKKLIVALNKSALKKFCMKPWYSSWLQDRIPYHRCDEDVVLDSVSCSETMDRNLPFSGSEENILKLDNSDEKLLSDFESVLNELESLNKIKLNVESKPNLNDNFPLSLLETAKDENAKLELLESQLEYYENFLKE